MALLVAIACAAVAACCFAAAATMQHAVVRTWTSGESLGLRAIGQLVRSRRWQVGTVLAITGAALHVVALTQAPLVIVQPIGVLSLVVTVLLSTRVRGVAVGAAVLGVCAGTGGFVALAAIAGTTSAEAVRPGPVVLVVAGAVGLTGLALAVRGRVRCLMLGTSSAVLFGSGAALIRTAALEFAPSGGAGLGLGVIAVLLLVSGGWVQHQAYASGPAAVVVATTTLIDPVAAVVISVGVYGEAAKVGPAGLAAQLLCAALAGAAVVVLARSIPDPRRPAGSTRRPVPEPVS